MKSKLLIAVLIGMTIGMACFSAPVEADTPEVQYATTNLFIGPVTLSGTNSTLLFPQTVTTYVNTTSGTNNIILTNLNVAVIGLEQFFKVSSGCMMVTNSAFVITNNTFAQATTNGVSYTSSDGQNGWVSFSKLPILDTAPVYAYSPSGTVGVILIRVTGRYGYGAPSIPGGIGH